MKLYLAGPDVFRADVIDWAHEARALCQAHGHQALLPLDGEASTASAIFAANLALIREADAVLARLDPFRGFEPDSGTCFELGYAHALGKRVIAYFDDMRPVRERGAAAFGVRHAGGHTRDPDGMLFEDFGLPLNLMLAVPCHLVQGGLSNALDALETLA